MNFNTNFSFANMFWFFCEMMMNFAFCTIAIFVMYFVNIFRGDTINVRLVQYFELVFKLVKTMVDHYSG